MESFQPERWLDQISGDLEELYDQIDEGEHQEQDFKFRIDSSEKIARTMSAFANTDGGSLLIGVKDNGRIAGVEPEEEYYMIEGASSMYCKPPVKFKSLVYENEDRKKVLKIDIAPSSEKPHYSPNDHGKWKVFIRQKDENFEGNRVIANYLKNQRAQSKRKNYISYGPEERVLFDYLADNPTVSLSKFSRLSKISISDAEKILIAFLQWEVIEYFIDKDGVKFHLKN